MSREIDAFSLDRFVAAQASGNTYAEAVAEIRRGRKRTHWMWFVFPQITGLGESAASRYYAIGSLEEAKAYLGHEILGSRLLECATALTRHPERSAESIFGGLDAKKLHSSMTLFHLAAPDVPVFAEVLDRYFGGLSDEATEGRLRAERTLRLPPKD